MKYFDEATNQVVDTGTMGGTTTPSPSVGFGGIPNTGQSSMGGQVSQPDMTSGPIPGQSSALQRLLGLYALSKGDPSQAWGILKPTAPKKQFSDAAVEKINNTRDTLDRVDRLIGVLNQKGSSFPQGFMGKLAEKYVSTGAAGTFGGLDPQVQQAIGDMLLLRGQGDRQLIGGRLTGYLLDRLGVGFPGVEKSSATNLRHLTQLKKTLISDLDAYAKNSNLSGYKDLLDNSYSSTGDTSQSSQGDVLGIQ